MERDLEISTELLNVSELLAATVVSGCYVAGREHLSVSAGTVRPHAVCRDIRGNMAAISWAHC
jgi:hypothetical protein